VAVAVPADELRRLRWRCRRGLLENDLVLARFLDRHAAGLDQERLAALNALLESDDNDLWDLLSGRVECRDPRLAPVVAMIRDA
jgi:succinate dehydrogenase flavin-adding protein (antitoxin of CptAB toxin-antitoxin module)